MLNRYVKRMVVDDRLRADPGWLFLTGKPDEIELLHRWLAFVDLDPVRDPIKSNHTRLVRYGNEPLKRRLPCPCLARTTQEVFAA